MLNKLFILLLAIAVSILVDAAQAQGLPPSNCTITASPPTLPAGGGSVSLTAGCTGGGAPNPAGYTWTGPGVAGQTSQIVSTTITSTSTFTMTASNGFGTSPVASITVFVNPPAPVCTITQSPAGPVNAGTLVTLTANCTNNPTSYLWSANAGGATTPFVTVSPAQTTTYTVTATNAGGTSPVASITVFVNPPAPVCTITQSPAGPVNIGTPVTLTANCTNNPTSYLWSANAGGATTSFVTVTPAQTTTYTVTATNAGGTSPVASITVQVNPPAPVCTITQNPAGPVNIGTPVTLTANCTNNPTSYLWSANAGGATTPFVTVTPSQTTSYTVTATNAGGTSPVAVITVQVNPPAPVCTIQQTPVGPINAGTAVTLTTNCTNNPTSYLWSANAGGATTSFVTVNPSQTSLYTVTATNAGGTSPVASITVQVNPPVCTIQGAPQAPVDPETSVTLTANCTGLPTSYSWSTGGAPAGSTQSITVRPTRTTIYQVTATGPSGSGQATATVSVNLPVAAQISPASASGSISGSGDNQLGTPGAVLPNPLVVKVLDAQGHPFANAQFLNQVTGGTGTLTLLTPQPADGIYQFSFQLGPETSTRTVSICLANRTSSCVVFHEGTITQQIIVPAQQLITPLALMAVTTPAIQLNNIRQRLDQLRFQGSAAVTQALRVSVEGQALPPLSALALAPANKERKSPTGGGASADKPDPFERWGMFVNGDIDIGKQSAVGTQTGFKLSSKGITLGTDYRFEGNHVLGAAVGLLKANTDLSQATGSQDAKGLSLSLYGSYVPLDNAYIDATMNLGHNKYDSQRLQTTGGFAQSNTSGNQLALALNAGYAFNQGPLTATPFGRVEYINASVNGFTEAGSLNEALTIGEQRVKATTVTLGGQMSYAISTTWGVLLPNARVEFQHVVQSSVQNVTAALVGSPTPPTIVPILGQDKTFGNFAVGASAIFAKGFSCFVNYEQLFGKDNYSDRKYTLGLRIDF